MISLRPARFDELGLRRAMSDRLVPFLIACMAFLASLAIAGWLGADVLARHWESGAASALTIQVPRADEPASAGGNTGQAATRMDLVLDRLRETRGIESARPLSQQEVNALLRSWLGTDLATLSIPVPAVVAVKLTNASLDLAGLRDQLSTAAPGTIVEDHAAWAERLETLARSLQLCSGFVLLMVTLVTAAVIAVATRSGLAARREEVTIVSQLGATDGYIVRRFANRTATLALIGGAIGGVFALPVVFTLATLAMPLGGGQIVPGGVGGALTILPPVLWFLPVILPAGAAIVGYLTTQATMRRWLRVLR